MVMNGEEMHFSREWQNQDFSFIYVKLRSSVEEWILKSEFSRFSEALAFNEPTRERT